MALTVVSSKFALLPDDDADMNKRDLRNKVLKGKEESSSTPKSLQNQESHSSKIGADNKNGQKAKKNKNKKKKSPENLAQQEKEQLEAWKSQNQAANDEAFAQDLQAAILASKIQCEMEVKKENSAKFQPSKKATMSLQDFNRLDLNGAAGQNCSENSNSLDGDKFWNDVDEATKKALNREQIKESLQQRYNHLPDTALVKQYKSILESKDDDIIKLTEENQKVLADLDKIKKRYKTFRDLLDQVECRDKATVISENIKLKRVQEELGEEVRLLREENEKLKTKIMASEKDLHRPSNSTTHR